MNVKYLPSKLAAALTGASALALAACVPPSPEATPAPSPAPVATTPAPAATAPPAVNLRMTSGVPQDWHDRPRTMGDWTYLPTSDGSATRFTDESGTAVLAIACSRANRSILIGRLASGIPANPQMDVRAETAQRSATVERSADGGSAVWSIPANDTFLDAIAFSRGHFAVGVSGTELLLPPAFPEITRVIEDCRS